MEIALGDKAKDTITGFTGIVVGRTEWLNGCIRLGIQTEKLDKEGKTIEPEWFDEDRIKLVGRKKPRARKSSRNGGPMNDPTYM